MNFKINLLYSFVLSLVLSSAFAQTGSYHFIKKIALPGDGKWDYLKMDGERERLFVSHFDKVHVIDLKTDKQIGLIPNLNGAHGIALAKAEGKGYITNGLNNTVTVFDYNTFKTIKVITLSGKKPDAIIYDNFSKQVIAFCGDSQSACVISVKLDKEIGKIALQGSPEFAVSDNKGMIYNNLEDKGEVLAIDIVKQKVIKRFALKPNQAPTGITMDSVTNRLFITCNDSHKLVVMNAANGKIITALPIGKSVDAIIYDKERKVIVTANGEGSATIIQQQGADSYKIIQTLATHASCRTLVHRGTTHKLYFSGADMDGKTIKPNTFGLFVYGPATK